MKRAGRGEGPRREMQAVWGRESWRARVWKGAWVSPRPWRRMRTERGGVVAVGGGVMRMEDAREGWEAKWEGVGRVGMLIFVSLRASE